MSTPFTTEINEVFDLAFRFVTETNENIFLTGKAGTGKTTFLKYLKDHCTKNVLVAAPTGVAAINAGGVTLHSLFQLPFTPFIPNEINKRELLGKIKFNKQRIQLLRKVDLLIIDEISMVRCDIMDAIDTILKMVRRNYTTPFGGVQLLCIGDLYQLPPVVQNYEWNLLGEYYSSPFFFDSLAIKEQMPLLIELNKVYRQKDEAFVRLLNKVRNNEMDKDDFSDLHLRFNPSFSPSEEEKFITLTSHNNQADQINQIKLQRILSNDYRYSAEVENDFPPHMYPAEAELVLKKGAQVMFLKNDVIQRKYFNGKIGVISFLNDEKIVVDCDGTEITVVKETWENTRYTLNREDGKLEQETMGTFSQYPLRLAWAITIHKSQGLTFDKVMIDAGSAFSSGQVYVALSRCTSLDGIVLLSKILPSAIPNNENVIQGQQRLQHKGSLAERFVGARSIFTQQLIESIFSFSDLDTVLKSLSVQIHAQKDKLNTEAITWIDNCLVTFETQKKVGDKFLVLVSNLIKEEGVIENNSILQKRIQDAANHFFPFFQLLQQDIKNHPIVTEHKQTATIVNEQLNETLHNNHLLIHYLEFSKNPFSVSSFLKYKLDYVLPRFQVTCYASSDKNIPVESDHPELFATLKRWRDITVQDSGQPIYMIANAATLKEICTCLPMTKKDLLLITGFGKAKVDAYGDEVIDIVESYCHRYGLETNMLAKAGNPKRIRETNPKVDKTPSKEISLQLYKSGKTVPEIAKERNFSISTIEGHLSNYLSTGEVKLDDLVPVSVQDQIKSAIEKLDSINVTAVKAELPATIDYGAVRLVIASINTTE